jgi:hypothetical protein
MPKLVRDRCLLDLPVWPEDRDGAGTTSIIQDTYVAERLALGSPSELRPFVKRWRNLFLLGPSRSAFLAAKPGTWIRQAGQSFHREERALLLGEFDAKKVFALLQRTKSDGLNFDDWNVRIVGHLCLPAPLVQAFMLANYYGGCGHDLAMVRLYLDTWPQHRDRLRGETRSLPGQQTVDGRMKLDREVRSSNRSSKPFADSAERRPVQP